MTDYIADWDGRIVHPRPATTPKGVLVTKDHLERLAFDHGLSIQLDRQCAYATHRGVVFYAPLGVTA